MYREIQVDLTTDHLHSTTSAMWYKSAQCGECNIQHKNMNLLPKNVNVNFCFESMETVKSCVDSNVFCFIKYDKLPTPL